MVMVRALQKCFDGYRLHQAGDEFDYTGDINESVMIALEDEAPTALPKKSTVAKKAVKRVEKKPVPKAEAGGETVGLPNDVK